LHVALHLHFGPSTKRYLQSRDHVLADSARVGGPQSDGKRDNRHKDGSNDTKAPSLRGGALSAER
jgi:hypothetical protein